MNCTHSIKATVYGLTVHEGENLPPTVAEIQLLPAWAQNWTFGQVVEWALSKGAELDDVLDAFPRDQHDIVMKALSRLYDAEIEVAWSQFVGGRLRLAPEQYPTRQRLALR